MCLQPQGAGRSSWVNSSLLPPSRFVAAAMQLAMMGATEGDDKFVAGLAAERTQLGEAQMVGI